MKTKYKIISFYLNNKDEESFENPKIILDNFSKIHPKEPPKETEKKR